MSRTINKFLRLFTVGYAPDPANKSFLDRSARQTSDGLDVRVAVQSDRESRHYFGIHLARRGLQAVWIECDNKSDRPYRLDFYSVDPMYYTPLEAAYVSHFSLGKQLLSFGFLSWLFLPLLPLVPFKIVSARAANNRMNRLFKQESFRCGLIPPGSRRAGFVFTHLDEGTKNLDLEFTAVDHVCRLNFSVEVPGLAVSDADELAEKVQLRDVGEDQLKGWRTSFAKCTTNKLGTTEGDPLNLVVIGDRVTIRQCFGGKWDEAEAITLRTCIKTAHAFLLDAGYRYSPMATAL